jgi:phosphoribosylaminoimidazolecarboxamide formyltransferase/IMP cyclohydrolase
LNVTLSNFWPWTLKTRVSANCVEVLIAPKFSSESLDYLQLHKNLRVIEYATSSAMCSKDLRYLNGSLLVQDSDAKLYDRLEPVTDVQVDLERLRGTA